MIRFLANGLMVGLICVATPARADPVTFKVATVMPRGGPWTNALTRFAAEVKRRTKGQVVFKNYFGAVAGTETRAVSRLRGNQIQGVASAAVGLNVIERTVRMLELPMLFRSFKEFLFVSRSMFPEFVRRFHKRGFRLLALASIGWVYLYSKHSLRTLQDIKQRKHWSWKNDPITKAFFDVVGIRSQAMPLTDVLPSLQAGTVDTVYGMPHAVQALQWHTSVSYVLNFRITMSIACLVVRKDTFEKLTPAHQTLVIALAKAMQRRLNGASRTINERAARVMRAGGLKTITPAPSLLRTVQSLRQRVWRLLKNVSYGPADLQKMKTLLTLCRTTSCAS